MAHDPSFGFADYLSAADAAATPTLMPAMDNGAPQELYGLQTSMELLGMRGMHPAMPGAASAATAAHCGGSGDAGDSTMRFFLEQHQHQQQAPLSLSLQQHQHQQQHAPVSAWMAHEQDAAAHGHGHGAAWHLRSSRFLFPAQQLLEGFCSLPVDTKSKRTKAAQQQEDAGGGEGSSSSSSCRAPSSAQIQAMDALELQRLKDKLYIMLEEVDRRYRRYCEQMRGLAGGFEAVAGERAAAGYTALASKTISRHFRSLRDGVVAQLQAVRKALGEKDSSSASKSSPGGMTRGDTPRLKVLDQCIRQHKAMHQNGGLMMETHPWRDRKSVV